MLPDLKYALRGMAKAPVFTAVAVLSLALGIGANTAMFSLLDQILLRLLSGVKNPDELVLLNVRGPVFGSNRGANALSYPLYQDLRDKNQVFQGTLCRYTTTMSVSFEGRTERVLGELVSGNYFEVLGVGAAVGRVVAPEDDRTPGAHPVAVLSYSYWESRFGRDPGVVGKTLLVNNYPLTVIGVSQAGFEGVQPDAWPKIRVPVMMKARMTPGWDDLQNRRSRWVNVFGRLKPEVTPQMAQAGLAPLYKQILEMEVLQEAFRTASDYMRKRFLEGTLEVLDGSKGRSGRRQAAEKPLWLLMGMVGMVLIIACVNIANLLLARATARQKEMAVRLALGGSRWRILRQLLGESVLLSALGGLLGLAVSAWTLRALLALMPPEASAALTASLDGRILAFNAAVSLLTGLLFGLAPALQATRPELAGTLKDQAGQVAGGGGGARKALVAAQVALSVTLLIGAGLFVRTLRNLKNLGPGFPTENLVAFAVDPSLNGYRGERSFQFYRQLLDGVRVLPGVRSVSLAGLAILSNSSWDSSIKVEGYDAKEGENMNPNLNEVSPGYFATLGIPILKGRDFTEKDDRTAPKVCVVNEKFVQYFFGGREPLGRRIGMGGGPLVKTDIEIIGVVKDVTYRSLRDDIPRQVFWPYLAGPEARGMTVWARTTGDPQATMAGLRRALSQVAPQVPLYGLRTMEVQIEQSLVAERVVAILAGSFGILAAVLAAIGLYGVMAYNVARRSREIGIRIALGAGRRDLIWDVMRQVFLLVGVGIAIALPAAWGLGRLAQSLLYGVEPADPLTLATVVLGMALVAGLAGYLPAARAARVDPVIALRYE